MSHVVYLFAVSSLRRGAIGQWSCHLAECVSNLQREDYRLDSCMGRETYQFLLEPVDFQHRLLQT